jgi:hypothetical protein
MRKFGLNLAFQCLVLPLKVGQRRLPSHGCDLSLVQGSI